MKPGMRWVFLSLFLLGCGPKQGIPKMPPPEYEEVQPSAPEAGAPVIDTAGDAGHD